jgi:putative DNA primase/helicase
MTPAKRVGLLSRLYSNFLKQAIDRAAGIQVEKFARTCLDARRIASMLVMAESEIFIRPSELDTNAYLLNFLNGTVDLRTRELRPPDRSDYITKLAHYRYSPQASCPRWLSFLDQLMGGGPDASEGDLARACRMVEYLQRALGYSLTGCTIEKAVFVPFGKGDNGKSTMLSTFRHVIEEYSVLLQVDTLMVAHRDCSPREGRIANRFASGGLAIVTSSSARSRFHRHP